MVVHQVLHDPVARGGTRLLIDAAVTVRHGAEHYRFAEQSVVSRLQDASVVGALREEVDAAVLGRQIATPMAGHHLIFERSGATDGLPARVSAMGSPCCRWSPRWTGPRVTPICVRA